MEGTIDVLNVGDGDAIIVTLKKESENLVVVIDGGEARHYHATVKPKLVPILEKNGKSAPDIVVATHYDSDHIGGLIPLVDDYIDNIKEVWVHHSSKLVNEALTFKNSIEELNHLKITNELLVDSSFISFNKHIQEVAIIDKRNLLIESINQLDTFVRKIPPHKLRQAFAGYFYPGWPEMKVLGPTEEYYNSLFPDSHPLEKLLLEEIVDIKMEGIVNFERFVALSSYLDNPCQFLKTDLNAKLTPTNKASIIISIDNTTDRYLFTGDAGICSFKNIPDWEKELKDIYWLKIPHHGSDNNISTEIINIMKPKFADNSGDKYEDTHVLQCIGRNQRSENVRSTKSNNDLYTKI